MPKSLFQKYNFCTNCGTKYTDKSTKSFLKCSNCDFTFYINPNPCVGAVIPIKQKAEVLISIRNIEPGKDKYEVPGGFINITETPRRALERELAEELNIKPKILKPLYATNQEYPYQDVINYTIPIYYLTEKIDIETVKIDKNEVKKVVSFNKKVATESKENFAFQSDFEALMQYFNNVS